MDFIFTLIGQPASLELPKSVFGWGIILFYLAVIFWRLKFTNSQKNREPANNQVLVALLIILVPFTSLFLAFSVSNSGPLQGSLYAGEGQNFVLPVLSALPWVLAGGLLPNSYAVFSAAASGLLISLFNTHSIILPFEYGFIALIYVEVMRLRYRGLIFRFIRNPLVAVLVSSAWLALSSLVYNAINEPVWLPNTFGSSAGRITGIFLLSLLPNILGGAVGLLFSQLFQASWTKPGPLFPINQENGLSKRFLTNVSPLLAVVFCGLIIGSWLVSSAASRKLVEARMTSTAEVASDGIPFFINTGTDLLTQFAQPIGRNDKSAKEVQVTLSQSMRSVQFFDQLAYTDAAGKVISSYPEGSLQELTSQENGIARQAANGGVLNAFTTFSLPGSNNVEVSFAVPVKDDLGRLKGVLVGRTGFERNPYTQGMIYLLKSMARDGGEGYIIDSSGTVLYHPNVNYLNSKYPGELSGSEQFYTLTTGNNVQLLVYYRPSSTYSWSVVLAMPASGLQKATWEIALPLIALILIAGIIIYLIYKSGFSSVARSIRILISETERITRGDLDHVQYVRGDDEIGKLGSAFEDMRVSLKDRLEEQSQILSVNKGIAANLDLETSVQPILESAMTNGASMARVVFVPEPGQDPYMQSPRSIGLGDTQKYYAYLDDQVLALTKSRDVVLINNLIRGRVLRLNNDVLNPTAVISVPIKRDNHFLGALWVAYDQPRSFAEREVSFMSSLAAHVALAINNVRLYRSAELGLNRLNAILGSTPDPIIILDENDRIIIANDPARRLFSGKEMFIEGKSIQEVTGNSELAQAMHAGGATREIHLGTEKTYFLTTSELNADGRSLGKVCLLRDVSKFAEEDDLKSEFVATVSHDLRAPLILMRGNATMIQNVGVVNDQQKNYIQKILQGIDNMTRMVNNLLDLDRIESGEGLRLETVKAREIIDKVIASLNLSATQRNITLTVNMVEGSDPALAADSALLQQALFNLIENGIKFSPVGSEVVISCSRQNDRVVFEIKDNGKGIAPLDIPRLFEKNYRSSQREGFGLKPATMGLAIVRSVAERHKGRVWVNSQLGRGSSFFLEIPVALDSRSDEIAPDLPES